MMTVGFSTRKIDDSFIDLLKKSSGVPNLEVIPFENNGEYSLTESYNKILDQSSNDIVILCHDDIYFDTKNWGQKILKHFKTYFFYFTFYKFLLSCNLLLTFLYFAKHIIYVF